MKKAIILFGLIASLIFLSSCSYLQTTRSICDEPAAEGSLLCSISSRFNLYPEDIHKMIVVADFAVLQKKPEWKDNVIKFFERCKNIVLLGSNWDTLVEEIERGAEQANKLSVGLVILSEMLPNFKLKEPINQFDAEKLLYAFDRYILIAKLSQ